MNQPAFDFRVRFFGASSASYETMNAARIAGTFPTMVADDRLPVAKAATDDFRSRLSPAGWQVIDTFVNEGMGAEIPRRLFRDSFRSSRNDERGAYRRNLSEDCLPVAKAAADELRNRLSPAGWQVIDKFVNQAVGVGMMATPRPH